MDRLSKNALSQRSCYSAKEYSLHIEAEDLSLTNQYIPRCTPVHDEDPNDTDSDSLLNLSLMNIFPAVPVNCITKDRQAIEDELPLNLTGKDREDEIERRLRQNALDEASYYYRDSDPFRRNGRYSDDYYTSSYCFENFTEQVPCAATSKTAQVFVAPDFLGMHELQDLRTHTHDTDNYFESNLLSQVSTQTLDLSVQSLDLSLQNHGLTYQPSESLPNAFSTEPSSQSTSYAPKINSGREPASELSQPLPPASSLPLPLSITQSFPPVLTYNQVSPEPLALTSNADKNSVKKYQCAQCAVEFRSRSELQTHTSKHEDDKPFKCRECGVRLSRQSVLQRHMQIHTQTRNYACQECGKKFAQKHDLLRHSRTHSRNKPSRVKPKEMWEICEICGASMKDENAWRFHMWRHTKNPSYIIIPTVDDQKVD